MPKLSNSEKSPEGLPPSHHKLERVKLSFFSLKKRVMEAEVML